MKKLLMILGILISINCATFRHNAIPVQEKITDLLESISRDADKAVSLGIMTAAQRQEFAKSIMLPSIDAANKVNECLLNNACGGITVTLTKLSSTLLNGINNFINLLPASDIKISLLGDLNSAITFTTNLYLKVGGKLEAKNSKIYYTNLFEMVS